MQAFMKYEKEFRNHEIIRFEFVAIDIIGVTFDVTLPIDTDILQQQDQREGWGTQTVQIQILAFLV